MSVASAWQLSADETPSLRGTISSSLRSADASSAAEQQRTARPGRRMESMTTDSLWQFSLSPYAPYSNSCLRTFGTPTYKRIHPRQHT